MPGISGIRQMPPPASMAPLGVCIAADTILGGSVSAAGSRHHVEPPGLSPPASGSPSVPGPSALIMAAKAARLTTRSACRLSSSPPAVTSFVLASARRSPIASSRAIRSATRTGSASTRFSSPSASASAASTQRPQRTISMPADRPASAGTIHAPTVRPRPGGPAQRKRARGPATRMSAAATS